jgi:hypothetical protein
MADIPQFGIYNEKEYKLAELISIDLEARCTYQLPDSVDGRYNLVLHGLLNLKVGEKVNCRVRFSTDFDA